MAASDSELALRVVAESEDVASCRQEAGEVLAREDVLGIVAGHKFVAESLRCVDAVQVGFALNEGGAVLARRGLSKATLSVHVRAP